VRREFVPSVMLSTFSSELKTMWPTPA
jgi:hypothetical protein